MVRERVWLLIAMVLLIAGCSAQHAVPVSDRTRPQIDSKATHYVVRRGDTLYGIAWSYGIDYRKLAKYNGIGRDYQIYPGQKLRLRAPVVAATQRASAPAPAPPNTGVKAPATRTTSSIKTPPAPPVASKPAAAPIQWRWPGSGAVVAKFSPNGAMNKGINLAGKRGDPVLAAASGQVVYAGNGLLGYGNLVIIDHNHKFLSAYAHNSRLLVKESDKVKAGQKIAEMGSSGAERVMLHFEIRRDGIPVDPLRYLPKK